MSDVRDTNFISIQGWMRSKLNLKGNELIVYALIYGFSQDGQSKFHGSRQYIADWCGCSLDTVDRTLGKLVDKGLLAKYPCKGNDGRRLVEYAAILTAITDSPAPTAAPSGTHAPTTEQDPWAGTANTTPAQYGEPTPDPQPLLAEPQAPAQPKEPDYVEEIVDHLNRRAGTHYRATTASTRKLIKARLKEGFSVAEIKLVIDKKCAEWLNNAAMVTYLRPETLFGNKFEGYLNAKAMPQNNPNNTTSDYSPYCPPVPEGTEPSCTFGW